MKTENVIGLALLGAAAYWLVLRRDPRTGLTPLSGLLGSGQGMAGWGAQPAPGAVYAPDRYAAGSPSYAGSQGSGNMNPVTTAISTIGNILKGFTARTAASSSVAPARPASPATPGGPSSATPGGSLPLTLNRGSLVDPANFYGDQQWFIPSSSIEGDFVWNAAPPDIAADNQNLSAGLGIFY